MRLKQLWLYLCIFITSTLYAQPNACDVTDQCIYSFTLVGMSPDIEESVKILIVQNGVTVGIIELTNEESENGMIPICDNIPFYVYLDTDTPPVGVSGLHITNAYSQPIFFISIDDEAPGSLIYEDQGECMPDACYPPYNVQAAADGLSAEISFAGIATGTWQYYITTNPADFPEAGTTPTGTATIQPFTVDCLKPQAEHYIYVREECPEILGGFVNSLWSEPELFTAGAGYSVSVTVLGDMNADLVCDVQDVAVPNMEIQVFVDAVYYTTVYTDAQGNYSLQDIPCGNYNFEFIPIVPLGYLPEPPVTLQIDFSGAIFNEEVNFCLDADLGNTRQFISNNFIVYPNPASSVLYIKGNSVIDAVEVFDVNGRICLEADTAEVNISDLKTGIYIVKISSGANTTSVKMVKL